MGLVRHALENSGSTTATIPPPSLERDCVLLQGVSRSLFFAATCTVVSWVSGSIFQLLVRNDKRTRDTIHYVNFSFDIDFGVGNASIMAYYLIQ